MVDSIDRLGHSCARMSGHDRAVNYYVRVAAQACKAAADCRSFLAPHTRTALFQGVQGNHKTQPLHPLALSVALKDTNDADFCGLRRRHAADTTLRHFHRLEMIPRVDQVAGQGAVVIADHNTQNQLLVAQPSAVTPHQ